MTIISRVAALLTTSFLGVYAKWSVCFSWRTCTSKFWCAFGTSDITAFSITFQISVRWTFRRKRTKSPFSLAFLFGSCLNCTRISKCTLAFRNPTYAVSCLRVFWAFTLPFPFAFSFAWSSYCTSVLVSFHSLWPENIWFSARDVCGPVTSTCNSRISCRRLSSLSWA